MGELISATYRNGVFEPQTPCDLPDGSEVDLMIQSSRVLKAKVTDPDEARKIMQRVLTRMANNPIPEGASKFNREALYDRG